MAGYVYDQETSLYYLMARYYDPETMRFLSRDPDPGDTDDPITQNAYTYANNNPVVYGDRDGNVAWLLVNAGFAVYDGYKAYKAGKSKKAIAWAAASNFIGIGKIAKVLKFAKGVGKNGLKLDLHFFASKFPTGSVSGKAVVKFLKKRLC